MTLQFHPLRETFGARVTGADLKSGIGAAEVEAIEQAIATYGVLVFGQQPIGDDEQQAFIQQFGPPVVTRLKEIASGHPHFYDISTVDDEGNPIPESSARGMYLLANLLWHTDGSQNQPPIRLTALHARVLPDNPPNTEYADMRAAWDALPASRQRELEGLQVQHSILWSREQIGMKASDFSEETLRERQPVVHPLVRLNARTGRKSLYLASHASHIIGRPLDEGRALVQELMAHATQPRFVYSHAWQRGELVMWDDSWTMHRATPYKGSQPRQMRWCGVRELEAV
ncbi:TauD/TfdA dioxygenase family protein [Ramlibacter sp. Leaf400]|uniref:TauD/TfdA dioxygenase family protein n=1 Tax=Ramlibacter sp. Leaf400 TaxID=1736365 RepID=UPI0006F979AB|nr:TauD/TfdA family dioxygenase [Ramlibacter sp. Leaf400]KQT13332.1 2,4-dichlorophenoxyacetate dioxygenase [Ramlibacter sp. Leaf400]